MAAEHVDIQSSVVSSTVFNGHTTWPVVQSGTRGTATTQVTRYMQVEGTDLLLAGIVIRPQISPGVYGAETVLTYASPLPRDKSFSLEPGGSHVASYMEVSGPPGNTTTTPYTITSYYLGQETLTVQGNVYQACKFQVQDSRTVHPSVIWYVKDEVGKPTRSRGLIVRSETHDGTNFVTREMEYGMVGILFAP